MRYVPPRYKVKRSRATFRLNQDTGLLNINRTWDVWQVPQHADGEHVHLVARVSTHDIAIKLAFAFVKQDAQLRGVLHNMITHPC